MPQKAEYTVIQGNTATQLQVELNKQAMNGARVILMSSASVTGGGIVTTVILERPLGS